MPEVLRLVYATFPSLEDARRVGRLAVESKLAACANSWEGMHSTYRWEGRIEEAREAVLLLKTTRERVAALMDFVKREHSYNVPAILALPVESAWPGYRDWVVQETK